MKIAVTGATGHVGGNMCRQLLKAGHQVRAIYLASDRTDAINDLAVEKMPGNILTDGFLVKAFEGMDYVIHLAALISIDGDPGGRLMQTNVIGVRNVVEACLANKIKKLIHFSSIHAFKYTEHTPVINESTPMADKDSFLYDQSKAGGVAEVLKGVEKGLNASIIHPTGIIGINDFMPSRVGQMVIDISHNRIPAIFDAGFNWVDVRDVCQAAINALDKGRSGEKYIIGGHWAHMNQFIDAVNHRKKIKKPWTLSLWIGRFLAPLFKLYSKIMGVRPLLTYESVMILKHSNKNISIDKARKELGYEPRPFQETLKDLLHSFDKQGVLG